MLLFAQHDHVVKSWRIDGVVILYLKFILFTSKKQLLVLLLFSQLV